ncbi:HD domain-containing protein [Cryptosporangium arvum]|uniref:HD domain-containing protein n=1 Tax=Cryptosporangium arvum TaxID=80871 RepID=UPI0004AF4ED1|nr:HD domain-containing protein [Cryptosporangium arvum]
MSGLPTDDEIEALHRRYAPSEADFALVHTHCRIVRDLALGLLAEHPRPVDAELVRVGALVHDLGVYRLGGAPYLRHGVEGYALLRGLGWPERIARFCSHHTGVGLTRADVVDRRLPLPVDDYLAETPEEELVMYADKFHSKLDPPVFVSAGTYRTIVAGFGPDKADRFDALRRAYGDPDLGPLSAATGHPIT